jgi:predicted DNA-binding protein (MmcQ/YjbR family)
MNLADFCAYCLSLPHVEETTPFGPDVLVYKVGGKMFALATPDEFPSTVNLKCDPDRAIELRDRYEEVQPGFHMNKRHWNTITLGGRVTAPLVRDLIDHSYQLVFASLPRKRRDQLASAA